MKLSPAMTTVAIGLLIAGCSSQPAPSEPNVTDQSPAGPGASVEQAAIA